MSKQRKPGWLMLSGMFVALLPAVYMSGYYLMLAPSVAYINVDTLKPDNSFEFRPAYRFDSPIISLTLEPAHQLDRIVRRDRWVYHPAAGS